MGVTFFSDRVCARDGCGTSLRTMRSDAVWCSRACYERVRRGSSTHRPPTQTRRATRPSGVQVSYLKAVEACTRALGTFGVTECAAPIVARNELKAVLSDRQRAVVEARRL